MGKRRDRLSCRFRETFPALRGRRRMPTQLDRITKKAKSEPKLRFTSLAHLLTPEFLTETWKQINRRGASGVDGETAKEFEQNLGTRIQELCQRLKQGTYKAPPVRRVEDTERPRQGRDSVSIPSLRALYDRLPFKSQAQPPHIVLCVSSRHCSRAVVQQFLQTRVTGHFTIPNNICGPRISPGPSQSERIRVQRRAFQWMVYGCFPVQSGIEFTRRSVLVGIRSTINLRLNPTLCV
jgi:hypothetical protein